MSNHPVAVCPSCGEVFLSPPNAPVLLEDLRALLSAFDTKEPLDPAIEAAVSQIKAALKEWEEVDK